MPWQGAPSPPPIYSYIKLLDFTFLRTNGILPSPPNYEAYNYYSKMEGQIDLNKFHNDDVEIPEFSYAPSLFG